MALKRLAVLIVFLLSLGACQPEEPDVPSAADGVELSQNAVAAARLPTATRAPTRTSTPSDTHTLAPSATPRPVRTPTPGPTPTPSATPDATCCYVALNGDDANDGSFAQPWRDIAYAVRQLQAGQTLHIMPGTYVVASGGERITRYAETAHAGTVDAPITIKAYARDAVIVDGGGLTGRFLTIAHPYWIVEGFEVQGFRTRVISIEDSYNVVREMSIHDVKLDNALFPNAGTTIAINVANRDATSCSHIRLENNHIYDIPEGEAIYLGSIAAPLECSDILVAGNELHGVWEAVDVKYNAVGNLIRNNLIYDCANFGINAPNANVIDGNRIHDCGRRDASAAIIIRSHALVVNNLVYDNPQAGVKLNAGTNADLGNQPMGFGNLIAHNTIVGNGVGISFASASDLHDNRILNNISAFNGVQIENKTLGPNNLLDHNLWFGGAGDRHALDGAATLYADPGFVDRPRGDFRLRAASPARDAGLDLSDVDLRESFAGTRRSGEPPDIGALEN
jgi:hypothetical protein